MLYNEIRIYLQRIPRSDSLNPLIPSLPPSLFSLPLLLPLFLSAPHSLHFFLLLSPPPSPDPTPLSPVTSGSTCTPTVVAAPAVN